MLAKGAPSAVFHVSVCSAPEKSLDESYYNLSNLQNKNQKHVGFEAEVAANKSRLVAINTEARSFAAASLDERSTIPTPALLGSTNQSLHCFTEER